MVSIIITPPSSHHRWIRHWMTLRNSLTTILQVISLVTSPDHKNTSPNGWTSKIRLVNFKNIWKLTQSTQILLENKLSITCKMLVKLRETEIYKNNNNLTQ